MSDGSRSGVNWMRRKVPPMERAMVRAYHRVMYTARERDVDPRIAAYSVALERLATAYRERGIFP